MVALQQSVTREIRELLDGLRPPVLDQLGLVAALRQRPSTLTTGPGDGTGHRLQITLDAPADLDLPAAVEVAAYRIVLESLANVTRHATAHAAQVRLWQADDVLLVQVTDNAVGLPSRYRAGVGLVSMRE